MTNGMKFDRNKTNDRLRQKIKVQILKAKNWNAANSQEIFSNSGAIGANKWNIARTILGWLHLKLSVSLKTKNSKWLFSVCILFSIEYVGAIATRYECSG